MNYLFRQEKAEAYAPGDKVRGIYDDFSDPEYQNKNVLCLGQLKTLFGEPLYISENLEDQFCYCIVAAGEDNEVIHLQVYGGSSGLAIGGLEEEQRMKAAEVAAAADALVEYITQAKAEDYDYEGYYLDSGSRIKQGVKAGVPYYEEELMELSEEEFNALWTRLYKF